LEKAERILGINKGRPDVTDELNVPVGGRPLEKTPVDDVALSDYEKDSAEKQFCRGDVINPKTNRPYTKDEALVRALKAKKDMLASRRAR